MPGRGPRGVVYPTWFRERILEAGGTPAEKSVRFGANLSTFCRHRVILRETGSAAPKPRRGGHKNLTTAEQDQILRTITLLRLDTRILEAQAVLQSLGIPPLSSTTGVDGI